MKLLLTNDWHFATKTPVSRTDDYNAELFGLLAKVARLSRHVKAEAILHAGDVFHDKGRVPWAIFARLSAWLAEEWARGAGAMIGVPGNHDMRFDRRDTLPETPFGALAAALLFRDISHEVYALQDVMGTGEVRTVMVYGVPWPDAAQPDAFTAVPPEVEIVVAHAFATPEGGERWGQFCHRYSDLVAAAPHVKLWHFGHDHSDNGVATMANGAVIVNIGALCRGALDTDNLTRTVKVAIADLPPRGPVTVTQVDLQALPATDIFDLQLRAQKVAEHEQVERFVAQLRTGLDAIGQVDYRQVFAAMPLDAAVREKVRAYIDAAESPV